MFIKSRAKFLLATGSILAILGSGIRAQIVPHQAYSYHKIVLEPEAWNWTKEAWNGDNTPYQVTRSAIDQETGSEIRLTGLLSMYKAKAQKNLNDPLMVYRWGYAAYNATTRQDKATAYKTLDGVQQALQDAPSPRTYDYARLRFLVGEFYTTHRQAVPVAQRLLARENKDYLVAYRLAEIYLEAEYPARIQEALSICSDMKQEYPLRSSIYALTGEAYILEWHRNHAPADAHNVVENYQKYLEIAPPEADFRKRATQIIDEFQKKA